MLQSLAYLMLSEVHDIPNPYNVKMEDELSVNSE